MQSHLKVKIWVNYSETEGQLDLCYEYINFCEIILMMYGFLFDSAEDYLKCLTCKINYVAKWVTIVRKNLER